MILVAFPANYGGGEVWINPDDISSIVDDEANGRRAADVWMKNGDRHRFEGFSAARVIAKISEARRQ